MPRNLLGFSLFNLKYTPYGLFHLQDFNIQYLTSSKFKFIAKSKIGYGSFNKHSILVDKNNNMVMINSDSTFNGEVVFSSRNTGIIKTILNAAEDIWSIVDYISEKDSSVYLTNGLKIYHIYPYSNILEITQIPLFSSEETCNKLFIHKNILYYISSDNFIRKYNLNSNKYEESIQYEESDRSIPSLKGNTEIIKISEYQILFRQADNLYTFNLISNKIERIHKKRNSIRHIKYFTNFIFEGNEIWFATQDSLFRFDTISKQKSGFVYNTETSVSQFNLYVTKLKKNKNFIYVTSSKGLVRFDVDKKTFKYYTTQQGLIDNQITSIQVDTFSNIWLGTMVGISRFNQKYEYFTNYNFGKELDMANVVPSMEVINEYNPHEFFFGSTDRSLISTNTKDIDTIPPKIAITQLYINNQVFEGDSAIYLYKNLELTYDQDALTFEFAVLHFADPKRNYYAYMLEGYDENWVLTGANNRRAVYTNLSPGEYTFRVKGANSDGVWNETGVSIKIIITPPIWKTTMAYVFYILGIVALFMTIIKIRERKLLAEKLILEKLVDDRTKEIQLKNITLEQQKEEILTQNEQLIQSKEEIQAQNEEITIQKDLLFKQQKDITDSIHYASKIQMAVLPARDMLHQSLPQHFILWKPRDVVSGDFYWYRRIKNYSLIAIADCTGHGVPGAFMSMLGMSLLNEIVTRASIDSTGLILNNLRRRIKDMLKQEDPNSTQKDGMDMVFIAIDHDTLELQYSGAYNPLYIIRQSLDVAEVEQNIEILNSESAMLYEFKADRQPVAVYIREFDFSTRRFQLQSGDMLYAGSDGYADQTGGVSDKKFMSKNFKKMILGIADKSVVEQKEFLEHTLETWKNGKEQIDDILIFGLKI